MGTPILYIVVPCYNEEEVLRETNSRLTALLRRLVDEGKVSADSRVMYVNDGSRDRTWQLIRQFHDEGPVRGVNLAGNVGHQHALLAGMTVAKDLCDVLVSIDADLQDDIEAIPAMLARFADGCDIVYGVRKERKTDTFFKRNTALAFYKLMRALGVKSGLSSSCAATRSATCSFAASCHWWATAPTPSITTAVPGWLAKASILSVRC